MLQINSSSKKEECRTLNKARGVPIVNTRFLSGLIFSRALLLLLSAMINIGAHAQELNGALNLYLLEKKKSNSWFKKSDLFISFSHENKDFYKKEAEQGTELDYQAEIKAQEKSNALGITFGGRLNRGTSLYTSLALENFKYTRNTEYSYKGFIEVPDFPSGPNFPGLPDGPDLPEDPSFPEAPGFPIEGEEVLTALEDRSTFLEVDQKSIEHTEEKGLRSELSAFLIHQFNRYVSSGASLYFEHYDSQFEGKIIDESLVGGGSLNTEDFAGRAGGSTLFTNLNYKAFKTEFLAHYAFSREYYRGRYFGNSSFNKTSHVIELAAYKRWSYGLSSNLSISHSYTPSFDGAGFYFLGPTKNKFYSKSFETKYLVNESLMVKFAYQSYDFGVDTYLLSLNYKMGGSKPKRRKRRNSLMRGVGSSPN